MLLVRGRVEKSVGFSVLVGVTSSTFTGIDRAFSEGLGLGAGVGRVTVAETTREGNWCWVCL